MKILGVSHSCVTDVNQQLYLSLQKSMGAQVELIVPAIWKNQLSTAQFPPSLLPAVDFPVHQLPVNMAGNNSLYFYRSGLQSVIEKAAPDAVFLHEEPWTLSAAQVVNVCTQRKIPFVCYTMQNIQKQYPFPFSLMEHRTYRSAMAMAVLSDEVRQVMVSKGFNGESPLLALACDLTLFYKGPSTEMRRSLGLSGTVIGYMGRLVKAKGLDTLVEAFMRIKNQLPDVDVSLLIVGSGPEEQALKKQVADAGLERCTVFTGTVPHTRAGDYMRCMDVFVLPSRTTPAWKEQFGRVIIEAMACGVPVVGSDSGQIPYLIRDTGGGSVFHEGDAADLAAKLENLVIDPSLRQRLGAVGEVSVRRNYTYDAIARVLYEIVERGLRAKAPAAIRRV